MPGRGGGISGDLVDEEVGNDWGIGDESDGFTNDRGDLESRRGVIPVGVVEGMWMEDGG